MTIYKRILVMANVYRNLKHSPWKTSEAPFSAYQYPILLTYKYAFSIEWGQICLQVKKQRLELDMEQLFPNWEKSTSRLYVVTLLI